MEIKEKEIKGVYEVLLDPRGDERGFFMRTYDDKIFKELGIDSNWVQENHSLSKKKGTLRGMHFQYPPHCECKIFRAGTGEMFYAVVDLRKDSKTFGKWTSLVLSAEKKNILIIPRGCAAGMCTLSDDCNLLYKVDNYYAPNNEESIKWDDPDLAIEWPIEKPEIISERDNNAKSFKQFVEETDGGITP